MLTLLTASAVIDPLAAAAAGGLLIAGFIGLLDYLSQRSHRRNRHDNSSAITRSS